MVMSHHQWVYNARQTVDGEPDPSSSPSFALCPSPLQHTHTRLRAPFAAFCLYHTLHHTLHAPFTFCLCLLPLHSSTHTHHTHAFAFAPFCCPFAHTTPFLAHFALCLYRMHTHTHATTHTALACLPFTTHACPTHTHTCTHTVSLIWDR